MNHPLFQKLFNQNEPGYHDWVKLLKYICKGLINMNQTLLYSPHHSLSLSLSLSLLQVPKLKNIYSSIFMSVTTLQLPIVLLSVCHTAEVLYRSIVYCPSFFYNLRYLVFTTLLINKITPFFFFDEIHRIFIID